MFLYFLHLCCCVSNIFFYVKCFFTKPWCVKDYPPPTLPELSDSMAPYFANALRDLRAAIACCWIETKKHTFTNLQRKNWNRKIQNKDAIFWKANVRKQSFLAFSEKYKRKERRYQKQRSYIFMNSYFEEITSSIS